jgi:hypothetical protein
MVADSYDGPGKDLAAQILAKSKWSGLRSQLVSSPFLSGQVARFHSSQHEFGENEDGKAAENANQKEAYKLFAVH